MKILFVVRLGVNQMPQQGLAVHETLELHELLTFKTVCMTKSKTMQALVTDDTLKSILQKDVQNTTRDIQELQSLLSRVQ
jgi:similar to spore coat protein